MKIGIPNTLFAAYHLPYWQQFLGSLGLETVLSGESRKELVDGGGKLIPAEFCVPVKAFLGHVLALQAIGVDLILVPRMTSRGRRNFFCPKLIGLPEIVRYAAGLDEAALFSPEVICNGFQLKLVQYPRQKIRPNHQFHQASRLAERHWEQTLARCRSEHLLLPEALRPGNVARRPQRIKLGLLGYAYALYDPFISKGIAAKLAELGAALYTWEMLDTAQIEAGLAGLKRPLFWNFSRILLGAGRHFLADPAIDGLIYATTFGCGPDSVAVKLLSLEASRWRKPFLQLTLDEHNEDSHIKTRLEAFMDMLGAQKEEQAVEDHFPLSGAGAGVSKTV